jgi:hypothetical protein
MMIKRFACSIANGLRRTVTAGYHETVIDHYENPRNVGSLDKSKRNVGTGLVGAPACGDVMKLQIELTEDGTRIENAVFKVSLLLFRLSDVGLPLHPVHTQRS